MAYSQATATALSNQLRTYYAALDPIAKLYVRDCLLEATDAKDVRNVQLWLTSGATQRNFLNNRLSSGEYTLRETIVKAVLRLNNENVPLKTKNDISTRKQAARDFARYIKDPYTGRYTRSIEFSSLGFKLTYDTYGSVTDVDSIIDEDLIEFAPEVSDNEIDKAYKK